MCGIVGYIGHDQAAPVILDGLGRLEYRGYDSAGMAVYDGNRIQWEKTPGRLQNLVHLTEQGRTLPGHCGIGHTRWATHGAANKINSHPHLNAAETIAVVHNGIIENDLPLKKKLQKEGYELISETDTEVLAHLLECLDCGDPIITIRRVLEEVQGSYALAILFKAYPGRLYAVCKDSPLIIGVGSGGCLLASDVQALQGYAEQIYYPKQGEIVCLSVEGPVFYDGQNRQVVRIPEKAKGESTVADKGDYPHFMLKEIMEQPKVIRTLLEKRIRDARVSMKELDDFKTEWASLQSICIVGCGSAYYAGLAGKYLLESLTGILTRVELASEFRYRNPVLSRDTLVVVISQSGETADSLAALREASGRGNKVLGIVNVEGSTIAREADVVLFTCAGPEIAVATTKAYSAQLAVLTLLGIYLAKKRKTIEEKERKKLLQELQKLPEKMEAMLADQEPIRKLAKEIAREESLFFIGRGPDYAVALEAALKIKEIAYVHAEGYAAGELKHGTLSLVREGTPVVGILTQPALYRKWLSNIEEVKSRGGKTILLIGGGIESTGEQWEEAAFGIPQTDPLFGASLAVLPLQLLAYYVAAERGCDVDKPRNLAKSVTVE